ncbi:MAG: hypothetical protein ACD_82C00031G0002 [uncultured bacterium]|jgi:hypothetical protein|nr:MAG: hypothetical protein ACD_82C00031G0002 [uncultured bacterium]KKP28578.1 MAG: hypothetical protein UR12_C0017G0006 [candidate division TM6 bacterium GW2011_GWF2_30_66]
MKNFLNNIWLLIIFTLFSIIFSNSFLYAKNCSACCCESCSEPCACDFCYNNINSCTCKKINECSGAPFLQYRSVSLNNAKEICGWQPFTNKYGMEKLNGSLYSSVEFTSSFRPYEIAQHLFGNDLVDGNKLIIQGSAVANRNSKAWLADYFGLPIDFESQVQFCPSIKNIIIDLNTYFGLDSIKKGLYIKVHLPIASTTWALNMAECVNDYGQDPFALGYMSIGQKPYIPADSGTAPTPILRSALPQDFINAVQLGTTFGDQRVSMLFGTMPCLNLQKTQFSDFQAAFGYNFILKKDFFLGASLNAVIPTGTRPDARYLFEPIVGNGKHWELGLGIDSSWIFYRSSENENRYAGIWLEATFTHMFDAYQARSFDFCNKPNSRYMLLLQMTPAADTTTWDLVGTSTTNIKEFSGYSGADIIPVDPTGEIAQTNTAKYTYSKYTNSSETDICSGLIPAINYTTRVVNVGIDLQADVAIKLGYIGQDFSFDIGYELWARTKEKISPCQNFCHKTPDNTYVIKGDGMIWGRDINSDTFYSTLSGSQSKADIHTGENMKLKKTNPSGAAQNMGVDNPQFAWVLTDAGNRGFTKDTFIAQVNQDNAKLYSSFNPILVNTDDIDTCQSTSAITHKIFVHINYEWHDKEIRWRPFAGIGGEAEFASKSRSHRAISQWGAWLKAGVSFQ